jgi:hypothetical protein
MILKKNMILYLKLLPILLILLFLWLNLYHCMSVSFKIWSKELNRIKEAYIYDCYK